jgi:hypothetical protein
MRVAFLILNHRDPAQLMRLLSTLRTELPEAPIVVHNDRFQADLDVSALDSVGNAYLLTNDEPILWGRFSMVDAILRSMAWMTEHIEFDWLIQLSAQDYPIKPLAGLGDYLAATGADVLLEAAPIGQLSKRRVRRNARHRYLYQYSPSEAGRNVDQQPGQLRHWLRRHAGLYAEVLNSAQPYVCIFRSPGDTPWQVGFCARSTPFTKDKPCWKGTTWISLSRRAAEFVVASVRERPDYIEYYRRTMQPGESAIATLVCNAPGLRVTPRDIHHVRWTYRRSPHPDVFAAADLPELLAAPEHEYFARKFSAAQDAEILNELDRMLAKARAASSGARSRDG